MLGNITPEMVSRPFARHPRYHERHCWQHPDAA
jgi:hypothetical protein